MTEPLFRAFSPNVPPKSVVAIPARNEEDEIEACLKALAEQRGARLDGAVICLNNCTDGSAGVVGRLAPALPFAVHVLEVTFPPAQACAGAARRLAMDRAAILAGPDGAILTTDADGRVAQDWLAANLASLRDGADAVAGQASIDPEGAALIPPHLHAIDARECAYAALLDEIRALIDPDPADPWPRHDEHSGASIAVTVAAYRRAGGMPAVKLAEDRAFFEALRQTDARIRHACAAKVVVSARIDGRAQGGMADTIKRRIDMVDEFLDERLEPVADFMRRARLRMDLRGAWSGGSADLLRLSRLVGFAVAPYLSVPFFGMAMARIETQSLALRRRRVALADLARETARAQRVRDALWRDALGGDTPFSAREDRAGMILLDAAE